MPERIAFRGKTPTELQGLTMDNYLKMMNARQRRTVKRNSFNIRELNAKVERMKKSGKVKPVKTHIREAVILPSWVGMQFSIHNGKEFTLIDITANMLGHRLGEFAYTTKRVQHSVPGIRATKGSKFLAVK